MKGALLFLLVITAAPAAADPPSSTPAKRTLTRRAATPTTATIIVGTEAPRPKVLVVHSRDARAVTGRPAMDGRLDGLSHHLR
jgi:hypothetical protein